MLPSEISHFKSFETLWRDSPQWSSSTRSTTWKESSTPTDSPLPPKLLTDSTKTPLFVLSTANSQLVSTKTPLYVLSTANSLTVSTKTRTKNVFLCLKLVKKDKYAQIEGFCAQKEKSEGFARKQWASEHKKRWFWGFSESFLKKCLDFNKTFIPLQSQIQKGKPNWDMV